MARAATIRPLRVRGFMIMDAIIGTAIVGTIMLVLALALGRERRAQDKLSQSRCAVRAAEAALAQLQSGRLTPADSQGAVVQVHDVASRNAPQGYHWVQVQATAGEQHETLVGLVRQAPVERGTP